VIPSNNGTKKIQVRQREGKRERGKEGKEEERKKRRKEEKERKKERKEGRKEGRKEEKKEGRKEGKRKERRGIRERGREKERQKEEDRQKQRERERGYHMNVRSIVISVSILFGLITEEASVTLLLLLLLQSLLLPWITLTQHDNDGLSIDIATSVAASRGIEKQETQEQGTQSNAPITAHTVETQKKSKNPIGGSARRKSL